jgi:hypothetical protein
MGTDSNAINIHELLHETSIYQMPLFQREYQWRPDVELSKFWSDVLSVMEDQVDSSFLGALVLQIERPGTAKSSKIYTVIDGQQRITTFFIIICALADYLSRNGLKSQAIDMQKQYLVSNLVAEKGKAKLVPTFRDNANFNAVLKAIKDCEISLVPDLAHPADGPMILAYVYFSEMIANFVSGSDEFQSIAKLEKLTNCILERMEVVQIILDKSHNANEVFDRLNTAGRPLGIIDLVRNEVFQTVSDNYDGAMKLYSEKWGPFEKSFESNLSDLDYETRSRVMDGYFFPYALVHSPSAKKNTLLNDLRKIWLKFPSNLDLVDQDATSRSRKINAVRVIDDLEFFRGSYLALDQGIRMDGLSDDFWEIITNLRRVPIPGVTHPYLMKLLSMIAAGDVHEDDGARICAVLESFFVRRGFVGLEPTGLHAIFKRLWIDAQADVEKVIDNIQTSTVAYPSDDEVVNSILTKPFYKKKIEKYVLWSFESELQKSTLSKLKYLPDITSDHIMPQNWHGDWRNIVSEEIHSKTKDLWGNILPLSNVENSAKGAISFAEAKSKLCHETSFATTKLFLCETDYWDSEAIIARSAQLAAWAISRWPDPAGHLS